MKTNTETNLRAAQHVCIRASTVIFEGRDKMPCKAGVRREQSQSSSPAQLPAAVLGATRGGFGVPEAQMSGGPSTTLGTAGSELVSSFPLWSALGLTAEAPAHPCLLLSFFSSKRSQKSSWIKVCYWPLHWGRGVS